MYESDRSYGSTLGLHCLGGVLHLHELGGGPPGGGLGHAVGLVHGRGQGLVDHLGRAVGQAGKEGVHRLPVHVAAVHDGAAGAVGHLEDGTGGHPGLVGEHGTAQGECAGVHWGLGVGAQPDELLAEGDKELPPPGKEDLGDVARVNAVEALAHVDEGPVDAANNGDVTAVKGEAALEADVRLVELVQQEVLVGLVCCRPGLKSVWPGISSHLIKMSVRLSRFYYFLFK